MLMFMVCIVFWVCIVSLYFWVCVLKFLFDFNTMISNFLFCNVTVVVVFFMFLLVIIICLYFEMLMGGLYFLLFVLCCCCLRCFIILCCLVVVNVYFKLFNFLLLNLFMSFFIDWVSVVNNVLFICLEFVNV